MRRKASKYICLWWLNPVSVLDLYFRAERKRETVRNNCVTKYF